MSAFMDGCGGIIIMYNLQAEKSILGSILQKSDILLRTTDHITAQDFHDPRHRLIYDAVLDLYQLNEPIDIITVTQRLESKGEIDKVKASYIAELFIDISFIAPEKHAEIIKQKSLLRKIKGWLGDQINKITDGADDIKELIKGIESNVMEISEEIKEKKQPDAISIVSDIHNDWNSPNKKYIPISIFEELTKEPAIPGFMPGHLYIIGGYTSVGKSTLLAQLAVDVCEQDKGVCIFSCEDSRQEKMIKIISNLSNVTQRKLIVNDIQGYESRIAEAEERIKNFKLFIYDNINTVEGIRLKIKKHKLQSQADVVFLDYIQNLSGSPNLYERMSNAILNLWNMAKELQVTMVVLSQVSNESMRQDSNIIGLKGAGELAACADVVLWLKRVKGEGKERYLDCEIKKNRPFSVTGLLPLQFSDFYTKIKRRD